ncbi:MAG: DUF4474 domain-containing protein [Clostridia bacterium]|nr:DUF4474 domain-containing protein [Clostridia bacterium]
MNELKNKSTILIIVALIIVCGGSFLGVRAINNNMDTQVNAPSVSYTPDSTTTTTTTAPSQTTTQAPVFDSTTMPSGNLITTFPGISGTTTTFAPVMSTTIPTTQPTTPALTLPTTAPTTTTTTTAATVPTAPSVPSTSAQGNNGAMFDNGLAGYKFNADGNYYFTADDPWQRNFGYNQAFDTAAPFVSIYMDTMRAKFRHGNKDWMIQFWKGQYGLAFIGSEIGVYTKPLDRTVDHYDAASNEEALYMSCTCYRNGEVIFTREYGKYWWCTGFIPGQLEKFSDRSELAVKCRITMKDSNMLLGFTNALKSAPNNLIEGRHYAVEGLDVFITWQ